MVTKQVLIPTAKDEKDFDLLRSYAPGEREVITKCFERAWRTKYEEKNGESI